MHSTKVTWLFFSVFIINLLFIDLDSQHWTHCLWRTVTTATTAATAMAHATPVQSRIRGGVWLKANQMVYLPIGWHGAGKTVPKPRPNDQLIFLNLLVTRNVY